MDKKFECEKCGAVFDTLKEAERHEIKCGDVNSFESDNEVPNVLKKKMISFLHKDEKIVNYFKGVWGTHSRWTDSSVRTSSRFLSGNKVEGAGTQWGNPWLLLTSQRVIIVGRGILTLDVREIPYEHIKSLDYEEGVLQDRLTILAHSSTEAIQFYRGDRKKTSRIPSLIKDFMVNTKKNESNKIIHSTISSADEVEKLFKLMKKGIISKEEFEKKKKNLLD